MASPLFLNLHVTNLQNQGSHEYLISVSHLGFGSAESGFTAKIVHMPEAGSPWGVKIIETKGGRFGYFSPSRMREDKIAFEKALSYLLNEWFSGGVGKVSSIPPDEILSLSGQVVMITDHPFDNEQVCFVKTGCNSSTLSSSLNEIVKPT